jgi:hypothetical protein
MLVTAAEATMVAFESISRASVECETIPDSQ